MMKKLLAIILVTLLSHSLVIAQGSVYKSGELIRVSETDSIQTQLMAAGQTLEIYGWLGNDLFSAAELLNIDGVISDDAILAGRRITVRGTIGDLLMGVGETIVIDGVINGDIFVAGREIRITDNARIKGNAHIAAASFLFHGGTIHGKLMASADNMDLNGTVTNKTQLFGHNFTFGSGYRAEYGTDITSDEQVYRENLGHIPNNLSITINEPSFWPIILFKVGLYLSFLITGLVLIRLFQQTSSDLYRFSTEAFFKNTGIGLFTFIVMPLAILLLSVLVLTIPLSIILTVFYGMALFVSYLLVALILGVMSISYFQDEPTTSTYYWGFALGMIVVAILVNLPFIGWFIHALLLFFGLGSLAYYIWMRRNLFIQQKSPNRNPK